MLKRSNPYSLDAAETVEVTSLAFAERSCSLVKVAPQVLQRHPVMGVRAAFETLI